MDGGGDLDESFSSEILESISDELLLLVFTVEGGGFVSGRSSVVPGNPNLSSVASKLIRSMYLSCVNRPKMKVEVGKVLLILEWKKMISGEGV